MQHKEYTTLINYEQRIYIYIYCNPIDKKTKKSLYKFQLDFIRYKVCNIRLMIYMHNLS